MKVLYLVWNLDSSHAFRITNLSYVERSETSTLESRFSVSFLMNIKNINSAEILRFAQNDE